MSDSAVAEVLSGIMPLRDDVFLFRGKVGTHTARLMEHIHSDCKEFFREIGERIGRFDQRLGICRISDLGCDQPSVQQILEKTKSQKQDCHPFVGISLAASINEIGVQVGDAKALTVISEPIALGVERFFLRFLREGLNSPWRLATYRIHHPLATFHPNCPVIIRLPSQS